MPMNLNDVYAPHKIEAFFKETIWGGTTLKKYYHKKTRMPSIAESWELSVREGYESKIRIFDKDITLNDFFYSYPKALGSRNIGITFPLLIKLINAEKNLSIQVHPNDDYAKKHHGELGKNEIWYIIEAEPGAKIVYGLKEGVSIEDFQRSVDEDTLEKHLNYIPVSAGDIYMIPSGMVHALGAGITVAEIQENSDITYRLYDYHRLSKDGHPRDLHKKQGKEVVKSFTFEEIENTRFSNKKKNNEIANNSYFIIEKIITKETIHKVSTDSFQFIQCVSGSGLITLNNYTLNYEQGDSVLIPAQDALFKLCGDSTVLITEPGVIDESKK